MSTALGSRKQAGFTLVELIIVILIIGILSALALPRFINMGTDARIAKAQAIMGAVRSAAQITRAASLVRGHTAATDFVQVDGVQINTNNGYPQAVGVGGIVDAAGLDTNATPSANNDGITISGGSATAGTAVLIEVNGAGTLANCSISYTAPATANSSPTITLTTSGC